MKCDSCEGCVVIKYEGGPFTANGGYKEHSKYFCPLMDYREMTETILECNMHMNEGGHGGFRVACSRCGNTWKGAEDKLGNCLCSCGSIAWTPSNGSMR